MKDFFKLQESRTTVTREMLAGVTTFLAMAYILAVNPSILGAAGMPKGGVFIATAIASFLGTTLMALFANYPFALAPGMGLNAYFAYTVVLKMGYSWQFALLAVFAEGLIFLLLSLTKVRESIFNCIPLPLKTAVSVGIVNGEPLLDLCYTEDSAAEVDMNVIMNAQGRFVELQGTGEEATFSEEELATLLKLARKGLTEIFAAQQAALKP